MSETQTESAADPIPQRPWREDVSRMTAMTALLAHPAMMLDKVMKQNTIYRAGLRNHQRMAGVTKEDYASDQEDDDMGVNIGNEIHNHYEGGQQAEAAKTTEIATQTGLLGKVMPYVGTALGAAGIAYGLAQRPTDTTKPNDPPAATNTNHPDFEDTDKTTIGVPRILN